MDTTEETTSFNNLDKDDENMNEEYDEDRLENNIIKNKPSPKIKQIFTGHRNARTMVNIFSN